MFWMDHFQIMGTRHEMLDRTLAGLSRSGVPLVSWDGNKFGPSIDDQGMYYFIPLLVQKTGWGLDAAIKIFFLALVALGLLTAFICFTRLFTHWKTRVFAAGMLLALGVITVRPFDVYVAQTFLAAMVIPVFLLLRGAGMGPGTGGALVWAGLLAGYCNFIRSQSGTGILLFLFFWILLNLKYSAREKAAGLLLLCLGVLVPYAHFGHLEKHRDDFLTQSDPSYQRGMIHHRFWHNAYIGLGYYPNAYGINYIDNCGIEKAASINPGAFYLTDEYEAVLRGAAMDLFQKDPWFILRTVFLKTLQLCVYFALMVNVGWFFYFKSRPRGDLLIPFAAAAFFYALPGILVIPRLAYVLGMISVAVLWGIFLTGRGLEKSFRGEPS